jgi:alpha-tubulin suppressor-like RCC1 family protein
MTLSFFFSRATQVPKLVTSMNIAKSFSSLAEHTHFIGQDGKLYAWGNNHHGALGTGTTVDESTPVEVKLPPNADSTPTEIVDFASGQYHNLLVTSDERLLVWGKNSDGQLGLSHTSPVCEPQELHLPTLAKPVRVFCGSSFSLIITEDGSLYTFGENGRYQLGGRPDDRTRPTKVEGLPPVCEAVAGWCHAFAKTITGDWYCWGFNDDAQVGFKTPTDVREPMLTPLKYTRIWVGSYHCIGETKEGEYYTFGWNTYGQLGLGHTDSTTEPIHLDLTGVVDIVTGGSFTVALLQDGSLFSWGKNYGNLGVGDTSHRTTPTRVLLPEGVKVKGIGASYEQAWAINEEGLVYLWGSRIRLDGVESSPVVPFLYPCCPKWKIPLSSAEKWWQEVGCWLFLGRVDRDSVFSILPIEVLFHFVVVRK